MSKEFFPPKPEVNPTIYGYTELSSEYEGLIKLDILRELLLKE